MQDIHKWTENKIQTKYCGNSPSNPMGFGLRDINRTHKAIMFENKKVERALRLFHCTATMCIQLSYLIVNNRPSWVLCTVLTKFNENVIQYKISRFICTVYTIWQACTWNMGHPFCFSFLEEYAAGNRSIILVANFRPPSRIYVGMSVCPSDLSPSDMKVCSLLRALARFLAHSFMRDNAQIDCIGQG